MRPLRLTALVVLACAGLSSCSLVFVDGPPQVRPGAEMPTTATCTTTRLIPVADGLLAASFGISATRLLEEADDVQVEAILAAYALPSLMAGSAVEGWRRVTRCQEFMLTPVRPPLVPRESSSPPAFPSRFPAWFDSKRVADERLDLLAVRGDSPQRGAIARAVVPPMWGKGPTTWLHKDSAPHGGALDLVTDSSHGRKP